MKPSRNEIIQFLNFIMEEKNKKKLESYISIKNAFMIYAIPFPSITIPKGKIFYRTRIHSKGEDFFENISDISYRSNKYEICTFGRANEPLQSIFYCSDNSDVAFFEVSNICKKGLCPDSEIYTIGIWQLQENIRVACIPINDTIRGLNQTADKLHNAFDEIMSKFNQENIDLPQKVLDVFSKEFTSDVQNNESNYLISCAFANYIYDVSGYDSYLGVNCNADGILYPSVIHREEGMNLALKPRLIDENKLRLVGAIKTVMKKIAVDNYSDVELKQSKQIDYSSGKIIWN